MKRSCFLLLFGLVLLLGSGMALAQVDLHAPGKAFSGLLELIRNTSNQWSPRLQGYARQLFWTLAVIDLVLFMAPLMLRGAELGELLDGLFKFILTIGFFATLLIYSVQWSEAIVNSFRQAGATAAGVGMQLTPGDLFSLGVELAYLVGDVQTMNPGVAISVALSALIILICFAFIAAFMAITLVESYIVINASVLFIGLGGSKFTREHAIAILRYALSVGAKLFILTLIVGLIMESARTWQAAYQHDNTSMWTMVGLALVCAALAKTIPDQIQSLINGVSSGGGGTLGGMAAAGAAGAAAGAAAMHSFMTSGAGGGLKNMLGGVADSLKGSGGSSGNASPMSSMGGGSGGSNFSGPPPRTGGGGKNPGSGSSPGSAPMSGGGSSGGKAGSTNSGGAGGATKAASVASMAHAAAEMGIKTVGTGMSMAIPGAEGSESLSVGPPPAPPVFDDGALQTPENIIRPADSGLAMGQGTPPSAPSAPSSSAEAPQPAINPTPDLQQSLDNSRGKP